MWVAINSGYVLAVLSQKAIEKTAGESAARREPRPPGMRGPLAWRFRQCFD